MIPGVCRRRLLIRLITLAGCTFVVLLSAATALAASTGPKSGSRAGIALAKAVLSASRHVVAVDWHEHGGYYECPGDDDSGGNPIVGAAGHAPSKGCAPATIEIRQNLKQGKIQSETDIVVAKGFRRSVDVTGPAGEYIRYGSTGCWARIGPATTGKRSITYAGEHVTIASSSGTTAVLRGTASGFVELDTIDTNTDMISSIKDTEKTADGVSRTSSTFVYPAQPFSQPKHQPVCPLIQKLS
jgi:hypothetical protein